MTQRDSFCLIKDLDDELQKVYIVQSRNKTVYFRFLVNLFKDKMLNDSKIKYMDRKQMGKKRVLNLLIEK